MIDVPHACATPLYTVDELRKAMAANAKQGIAGNTFLSVDTRVLAWLCQDAESLNLIILETHYSD